MANKVKSRKITKKDITEAVYHSMRKQLNEEIYFNSVLKLQNSKLEQEIKELRELVLSFQERYMWATSHIKYLEEKLKNE